ncbi:hypothetical protein, partial [uncultured Duncaniella sp.]
GSTDNPHTFATMQLRPVGFIALSLDAGLPPHRCFAAFRLPSGKVMMHCCHAAYAIIYCIIAPFLKNEVLTLRQKSKAKTSHKHEKLRVCFLTKY